MFRIAAAAMIAFSTSAMAQERAGAPDELIGAFGNSKQQCRSYNRNTDDVTKMDKDTISFCGGSSCGAEVLSHRITKDGYIIRLRSRGNPKGFSLQFVRIDDGVFDEIVLPRTKKTNPKTMVKCGRQDIIDGIGLMPGEKGLSLGLDVALAAYYALAVPQACDKLKVDGKLAENIITIAIVSWRKFLLSGPNASNAHRAAEDVRGMKNSGEYALREDVRALPDFCDIVVDKFGPEGTVLKNLISDPRRRA